MESTHGGRFAKIAREVGVKALVADDSEVMRKIMVNYLNALGFTEVELACDGAEALVKSKAGAFDMILLDWNMPKLLGIDVLRRLRGGGMQTPIVIVTTEANRAHILEAVKAGVSNYIIKPFQKDTFLTRVQQTLDKARDAA